MTCPKRHRNYAVTWTETYPAHVRRTCKCKVCGAVWKTTEEFGRHLKDGTRTLVIKVVKFPVDYNRRWRLVLPEMSLIETVETRDGSTENNYNIDLFDTRRLL